ncbi:MAG: sulfurtransferase TusA family protein [Streptomyces sp.]|nr:sulfurtransferase TusA family protein [Streptomyces sp.]
MTAARAVPPAEADITVDGTGLLCVTLLLKLRAAIDGADAGAVVHVIATDPAAPLDLPAWCHMTGHHYLGPTGGDSGRPVYALRLAATARRTRPDSPWRPAEGEA